MFDIGFYVKENFFMNRDGGFTVVGIGEVLWDRFSDGRIEAGGAALNIAYHANLFGDQGVLASRIGDDLDGEALLERVRQLGIGRDYLQRDEDKPTGSVDVALVDGIPTYRIHEDVAYDYLRLDEGWRRLASQADAVSFGTLSQRTGRNAEVLYGFLDACPEHCLGFLDVNLRKGFWSGDILERSLRAATAAKFNDEELPLAARALGMADGDDLMGRLAANYGLKLVAVTRGPRGCILVSHTGETAEHPGFEAKAVDTVGAGDSFVSVAIYHLLRGESLGRIAEAGNEYAAFITTRRSGSPPVPRDSWIGFWDRLLFTGLVFFFDIPTKTPYNGLPKLGGIIYENYIFVSCLDPHFIVSR